VTTKWYYNSKTGGIDSYEEEAAGYELKGVYSAYGDALTTGFCTREDAVAWSKKWGYCAKCNGTYCSHAVGGKDCFCCGSELVFKGVAEK
jgi:predicted nucleic acid binding AN1-type Zn finger protein